MANQKCSEFLAYYFRDEVIFNPGNKAHFPLFYVWLHVVIDKWFMIWCAPWMPMEVAYSHSSILLQPNALLKMSINIILNRQTQIKIPTVL